MLPSDKTLKKDITPAGAGPAGIPVFKYPVQGPAPVEAPKIAGPMAQDVQKVVPQAVSPIRVRAASCRSICRSLAAATEDNPSIAAARAQGALDLHAARRLAASGTSATAARRRAGMKGARGEHQGPSEDREGP